MNLLVLAQIPPPLHGQSQMTQTLVSRGGQHGLMIHHVPLSLSRDTTDIGRIRLGKIAASIRAALKARQVAREQNLNTFLYVPAPGKRSAVWRDIIILPLVRAVCPRLVLHFHAAGTGAWLKNEASPALRVLARRALGKADLAIVLAEALRVDAEELDAKRIVVVPNGIEDPGEEFVRSKNIPEVTPKKPFTIIFLSACTTEKGVGDTLEAAGLVSRSRPVLLKIGGAFPDEKSKQLFLQRANQLKVSVQLVGFVRDENKARLLQSGDCFCFPTSYPAEAFPLVVLEAMACDLPVVTNRWRGLPEMLPPGYPGLVEPRNIEALAQMLVQMADCPPPPGLLRRHFLDRYTLDRHLATFADSLRLLYP